MSLAGGHDYQNWDPILLSFPVHLRLGAPWWGGSHLFLYLHAALQLHHCSDQALSLLFCVCFSVVGWNWADPACSRKGGEWWSRTTSVVLVTRDCPLLSLPRSPSLFQFVECLWVQCASPHPNPGFITLFLLLPFGSRMPCAFQKHLHQKLIAELSQKEA